MINASRYTSYNDYLRRHDPHQVVGSKYTNFLSACPHRLPCHCFAYTLYTHFPKNASIISENDISPDKQTLNRAFRII